MTKEQISMCLESYPAVRRAANMEPQLWLNEDKLRVEQTDCKQVPIELIADAELRWQRFAPYLKAAFPETEKTGGIIESQLLELPRMKAGLETEFGIDISGRLLMKMDSHLPISGSIKARGGLYEVLKHAETLAVEQELLSLSDDYAVLASAHFQRFFSNYTIQVGSTGNLGLSIGIISAKLGFQVLVHMSADAKAWKKALLRSHGVTVIEYEGDYGAAVAQGRRDSDENPASYFVDDENSLDLFLGYSVAAQRLQVQLRDMDITVDAQHPLFVYLPCGVGGAPGGVAYGLRQIFGDHVHCFFAEPTQACCMLLGVVSGLHDAVSVTDFGISGKTEADGLAVNRPSKFIGSLLAPHLSGIATVTDEALYVLMELLMGTENQFIEPSACASFAPLLQKSTLNRYIEQTGIPAENVVHLAWATGGDMVPQETRALYLEKAKLAREAFSKNK